MECYYCHSHPHEPWRYIHEHTVRTISGFCRSGNEVFEGQAGSLTLEDRTDRLSANIGNSTTNQFWITCWNSKDLINIHWFFYTHFLEDQHWASDHLFTACTFFRKRQTLVCNSQKWMCPLPFQSTLAFLGLPNILRKRWQARLRTSHLRPLWTDVIKRLFVQTLL